MRLRTRNLRSTLLASVLAVHCLPLPAVGEWRPHRTPAARQSQGPGQQPPPPSQGQDPQQQPQGQGQPHQEQAQLRQTGIECEDGPNGITVSGPKIYDDSLLQQMLQTAEARLATLQVIDQASVLGKLGAVTGASQQISSFGLNVQGAPVPGVTTTTGLPTLSTTQVTAADPSKNTLTTVSGLGTQNVTTTQPQFNPPGATAPAPTTTLPSSFSVSASDILNEEVQLTAEINGLRLLLAGSLSDHFIKHRPDHKPGEQELTKLKETIGFNVSVEPDRRYKDAVAIVEVEIGNTKTALRENVSEVVKNKQGLCSNDATRAQCIEDIVNRSTAEVEPPAVTAIIPRDKTYNVAAIKDGSVSIGGGVATQLLGVSGSWLTGHKTYYLIKDQDTVALTYSPAEQDNIGFKWQFRPVLGQRYVNAGLKQTFAQVAFPIPGEAEDGEVGRVTVHTYWQGYDRKTGVLKKDDIRSKCTMYSNAELPTFKQPVTPVAFDVTNVEDLGGGQMMVKLEGRFLPGTYVRFGGTMLTAGTGLKFEYQDIKFTAPIAGLATNNVFLVAQDGSESPLTFNDSHCSLGHAPKIDEATVTPVDDSTSRLRVHVTPADFAVETSSPRPLFIIGQRVFGHADAPLKVEEENKGAADYKVYLSAIVPNAVYTPTAALVVKPLFAPPGCTSNALPIGGLKPPGPEKLTPLERGETEIKYLLTGTDLGSVQVLSPAGAKLDKVGTADPDKMRLLTLKPEHLKTNKQVLFQRAGKQPSLMTIPEFEPKKPMPPAALGSIAVGSDEVVIVGEGLSDVEGVTYKEQPVSTFKVVNDQTLRLSGLVALGLTSSAGTQRIFIKFKSDAKPKEVDIRVVNTISTEQ